MCSGNIFQSHRCSTLYSPRFHRELSGFSKVGKNTFPVSSCCYCCIVCTMNCMEEILWAPNIQFKTVENKLNLPAICLKRVRRHEDGGAVVMWKRPRKHLLTTWVFLAKFPISKRSRHGEVLLRLCGWCRIHCQTEHTWQRPSYQRVPHTYTHKHTELSLELPSEVI